MRKAVTFIFISMIFMHGGVTQNISQQLANYQDETAEIIKKGRAKISRSLVKNDTTGLHDLVNYLSDSLDHNYIALYPIDKLFLGYITGNYRHVNDFVLQIDSILTIEYGDYLLPESDNLGNHTLNYCVENLDGIQLNIELTWKGYPEQQQFHLMNFLDLLSYYSEDSSNQEALNNLSDDFIKTYTDSRYLSYVKKNINQEYLPSPWAFGTSLAFFTGATIYKDDLGERLKTGIPLNFLINSNYKRLAIDFLLNISLSRPRKVFEQDGVTWNRGDQANNYIIGTSLGYDLLSSNNWQLYPFVGFGGMEISPAPTPVEQNPEYEAISIGFSTYHSAGINLVYKKKNGNTLNSTMDNFWTYGLRFEYLNPAFHRKEEEIQSAAIYNLTFQIGMFSHKKVKKYH